MDSTDIILAAFVGAVSGYAITAWLYHRRYWLLPKDRTFRQLGD
jgi:hypothetical protein